jgi:hypothetical protein
MPLRPALAALCLSLAATCARLHVHGVAQRLHAAALGASSHVVPAAIQSRVIVQV